MRKILVFTLCLFPLHSFGQACTEATIATGAGTYNCTTLTISAAGVSAAVLYGDATLDINVSSDVVIHAGAGIDLSGEDGATVTNATGGQGGPGATNGGGYIPISTEQGGGFPNGGDVGQDFAPCGGGGGGGGFVLAGSDGTQCDVAGTPGGTGGTGGQVWDVFTTFQGGFGGGAGGIGPTGPVKSGSGGGGGGGIKITAGGNVTINANIAARGGNGGSGAPDSGGGGGGSGGVVWIIAGGSIVNNGTIDVSGGNGGVTAATQGNGGRGGNGTFRLQDSDGIIEGTGTGTNAKTKFKSDISCGTVSLVGKNQAAQNVAGFFIALMIGTMISLTRKSKTLFPRLK